MLTQREIIQFINLKASPSITHNFPFFQIHIKKLNVYNFNKADELHKMMCSYQR